MILTKHAESQYLLPLLEAGGSATFLKAGADTELGRPNPAARRQLVAWTLTL